MLGAPPLGCTRWGNCVADVFEVKRSLNRSLAVCGLYRNMNDNLAISAVCFLGLGLLVFEFFTYRSRSNLSGIRVVCVLIVVAAAFMLGAASLRFAFGEAVLETHRSLLFGFAFGASVTLVSIWLGSQYEKTALGRVAGRILKARAPKA